MEEKSPATTDEKEDTASTERKSFSIPETEKIKAEEPPARILFASDPREKHRHDSEIAVLPLSRTFSRNSYSLAADEETKRVKRVTAGKTEPQIRFPTEFRTLSINVTDTISRAEPARGNVMDISELEWHLISSQEACQRLGTSEAQGLDNNQVQRRIQQYGKNVLSPPPTRRIAKTLGYFFGGFGGMLFLAGVISIICYKPLGLPNPDGSNLALGVLLFVVVCIQGIFNAWQDWSSSKIMASITGMIPADTLVLRDGHQKRVPAADLVIGDIIFINLGNKVPADIRILQCSGDLKFDRAVLTGESEPVPATPEKTDANFMETHNIGMQGTHVVSGNGVGLVIQTGDRTVFGRIAKLSSSERKGRTTLQKEILRFVFTIGTISASFALLTVIIWAGYLRHAHPGYFGTTQILITAMSVFVAVIPEGLPISVTLSLTVIAKALAKNKVLCKSLTTVETLGAVNILCSDKTGTLTQNKMFVQDASILDTQYSTAEAQAAIVKDIDGARLALEQLQLVGALCNAAQFDAATLELPIAQRRINGDATDCAILRFSEELGDTSAFHSQWVMKFELPFNSQNKYMLRVFKLSAVEKIQSGQTGLGTDEFDFEDDDSLLLIKGAPDVLLPFCSYTVCPDGSRVPIDEELRSRITLLQECWASRGQRVILLARKIMKPDGDDMPTGMGFDHALFGNAMVKAASTGLTFIGLVGIVDPPREDIPEVVRLCRTAGIRFFMVTGDFPSTAVFIARQCGIVRNLKVDNMSDLAPVITTPLRIYDPTNEKRIVKSIAITGADLREIKDAQWDQLCQYEEIVFARTTPEQKLGIVREFQKRKNIVGMTGDGVNDAPSLKAADIGIAVGSGSDVAMEASDMVLLDSFSSIVVCIEYGRLVYDNLKKVIIYLLPAGTFCELWPILFPILFGLPQPLSSIEMIIISMLTDCIASMSLIKEKPEADVLSRPPRRPSKDRLTNAKLLFQAYFIIGIPMLVCACSMAFRVFAREGLPFTNLWRSYGNIVVNGVPISQEYFQQALYHAQSTYFVTLVLMHQGTLFMVRTRRLSIVQQPPIGPKRSRNLYLFGAMLISISLMLLFLLSSPFQGIFNTRAPSVEYWFIPFGFAMGLVLYDETRKFFVRRYPKGFLGRIAW